MRQTGFTLLEVLVALVIVAIALGASLRATGSLVQNSAGLRSTMMAAWAAENRLVQIRLGREYPAIGERTADCPQGELKFVCKEQVFTTPNLNFRRVEVSVYESAEMKRRITKMVQVVPRG